MIPAPFDYHRATSVEEALKALAEDDTQALAGGHSLIPTMKLRLNQPGKLIDISQIESLRGIRLEGDHLIIGAATTHGEIATSDLVREHAPWIADAAEGIGDIAVRNRGTIGGSLAHADPAADWPAVLIAGKCFCEVAGATSESKENGGGRNKHKAEEFFTGFYETALEEGQLITAVHVPVLKANQRGVYSKFPQPASRYAIVGAAAVLTIDGGTITEASVAVTGLTGNAYRLDGVEEALRGQPAEDATVRAAAGKIGEADGVMADHYASEEYRLHLAEVYVRRALMACIGGQ